MHVHYPIHVFIFLIKTSSYIKREKKVQEKKRGGERERYRQPARPTEMREGEKGRRGRKGRGIHFTVAYAV